MDYVYMALAYLTIIACFALAFFVFFAVRFLFDRMNFHREKQGLRIFPSFVVNVIAFLSALTFII